MDKNRSRTWVLGLITLVSLIFISVCRLGIEMYVIKSFLGVRSFRGQTKKRMLAAQREARTRSLKIVTFR